jgi:hypothetical protein
MLAGGAAISQPDETHAPTDGNVTQSAQAHIWSHFQSG